MDRARTVYTHGRPRVFEQVSCNWQLKKLLADFNLQSACIIVLAGGDLPNGHGYVFCGRSHRVRVQTLDTRIGYSSAKYCQLCS